MDKVREVVDKVTHPKSHSSTTHTGTTGTHTGTTHTGTTHTGTHSGATGTSGTAGPHTSNLANKADPRVDSDLDGSRNAGAAQYGAGAHQHGTATGNTLTGHHDTAGPHSSNVANKADPRVDSDLDGSRNAGAASYGAGAHNTGHSTGLTGSSHNTGHTTGLTGSSHTGSTNAGPHNSNLLNKADPRVDSDRDASRNFGAAEYGPGSHHTTSSTNAGPHNSNLLNKADPRVDSDRDASRNMGASEYGPGSHHTTSSTNHGPHNSNLLNKGDPRVDSDRDGSRNLGAAQTGPGAHQQHGTFGGATSGPGPAPRTAGPHGSDILNKLDPRVDSDRDGSKTVGSAPQY